MTTIGFAIWWVFESQQLEWIGGSICSLLIVTATLPVVMGVASMARQAPESSANYFNLVTLLLCVFGMVYLLFGVEIAYRVRGQARFELSNANELYCLQDGFFQPNVSDGQRVSANQAICELVDPDSEFEQRQVEGEIKETQMRIRSLDLLESDTIVAAEKSFLEKKRSSLEARLSKLVDKNKRRILNSPIAGQFVAYRPEQDTFFPKLRVSEANFFDDSFKGAYLRRGSLLGYVGSPDHLTGMLSVSEAEVQLLRVGQMVRVFCPTGSVQGEVRKIELASSEEDLAPQSTDSIWDEQIKKREFDVEIEIPNSPGIYVGSRRTVVVRAQSTNIWRFLIRKLQFVFR